MNTWITLFVIVVIVGAIIAYYMYNNGKPEKKPAQASAPPEPSAKSQDPPSKRFEDALEALLKLNQTTRLDLRLTDAHLVIIEGVIDKGFMVLPKAGEKYPGHQMSWEICRMLSHWLPEQVRKYAELSDTDRVRREFEFLQSMSTMGSELSRLDTLIDSGLEMEFEAALNTISQKYGNNATTGA